MARRTLRSAGQSALRLPPLLNRLIEAEARDRQRESATVLRTYGELALVTIPTRGVFAPADQEDLYRAIENAAREHLGLGKVHEEIKKALDAVAEFNDRDAIESAYNAFRDVSERAYFFAGLAFGVTMASLGDSTWR